MLQIPDLDAESKGISWIQSNPFDMKCTPAIMKQTAAALPTPPSDLEYSLVKGGHNCNRVTTVAECENAAKLLGLGDLEAQELPLDHKQALRRPPYCYYKIGDHEGLKFNPTEGSTTECSTLRPCICHTDGECCQVKDFFAPDFIFLPAAKPAGQWMMFGFFLSFFFREDLLQGRFLKYVEQ